MRENCTTTMPWRSSEREASSLNYIKTLLFPLCMHNNFRKIDTKLTSPVEVVNIKRKQEITQQMNTSSVLYMPMVTPPVPVNSNTSVVSFSLPSAGLQEISNTPGPFTTKSLARYWKQKESFSQVTQQNNLNTFFSRLRFKSSTPNFLGYQRYMHFQDTYLRMNLISNSTCPSEKCYLLTTGSSLTYKGAFRNSNSAENVPVSIKLMKW